ncbi:MAG: sulfite exporter TauE/SafE family protein, partial [Salinimicrobium sediminis]|nr:sulfite exporter TauE/SafE family protein [Salinimicrobium sediminis]
MLYSALILGILGSFHCIGMCGPIAFMLPVSRDNKVKKFLQIFLYHFGRLLSYSLIGLAFGLLGKSLNLFGLQQQLSIGIGILMITVILVPTKQFQKFNFSQPI